MTMPRTSPSIPPGSSGVRTTEVPYKVSVIRADPGFEAAKTKEPFYRFSNGREFNENTANQGAYSTVPNVR
jgi:hypothetical protein